MRAARRRPRAAGLAAMFLLRSLARSLAWSLAWRRTRSLPQCLPQCLTQPLPQCLALGGLLAGGLAAPATAQHVHGSHLGDEPFGWMGSALAEVGDLDGDGRAEWACGGFQVLGVGRVVILSGAGAGVLFSFEGDTIGDELGRSLAGVGDVDGDGVPDLLVGAPQTLAFGGGYVQVRSGVDGAVLRTVSGFPVGSDFGWAVAGLGDLNGDGAGDFAVGAPREDTTSVDAGTVRVYSGGPTTPVLLRTFEGGFHDARLGGAVANAGDVDGDGRDDLVAGTAAKNDLQPDFARVWSSANFSLLHTFFADAPQDYFGSAVAGAGDVDRDGFADVLVGGWGYDDGVGAVDAGIARLFSGASGALLREWVGEPGDRLGFALAGAGDMDADGWPDQVLGLPRPSPGSGEPGVVRVQSGRDGALLQTLGGPSAHEDQFGYALTPLGDLDGDGFDDLAAGSPNGFSQSGYAAAFTLRALQRPALIAVLGVAHTEELGGAADGGADLNGDGVPDFVAGGAGDLSAPQERGVVRAFSGVDGAELWNVPGAVNQAQFGRAVVLVDDVDDDGVRDVAVTATKWLDAHRAFVLSGADGSLLTSIAPSPGVAGFSGSLAATGDLDGDGYGDLAIGVGKCCGFERGRVSLHSARTGALIRVLDGPVANNTHYGYEGLCDAGDVDADGVPDILVGDSAVDGPGEQSGSGSAYLHSGADGSVIRSVHGGDIVERLGQACAPFVDITGDGVPDLLVGSRGQGNFGNVNGRVRAFSGADGALLYTTLPVSEQGPWVDILANVGDTDGDGVPDFAVADPADSSGGYHAGRVDVFSGGDGTLISTLLGAADEPGTWFGSALAGGGDVDGDGLSDVLVGALLVGGNNVTGPGRVSVFSARPPAWHPLGEALAGTFGTSNLWLRGELQGGDALDVNLTGSLPATSATFVLGLSALELPFRGGVLVPNPDALLPLPTDGDGAVQLATTWPVGLPSGVKLWVQAWIPDGGAVHGVAASNAWVGTTP